MRLKKIEVVKKQKKYFSKANTNNFMDYSGCRSIFSLQQCIYMREIVRTLRPGIWNKG